MASAVSLITIFSGVRVSPVPLPISATVFAMTEENPLLPRIPLPFGIEIRTSPLGGYGVFAITDIKEKELIEVAPFVLSEMRTKDLLHPKVRQTLWPMSCKCDECKFRGNNYALTNGCITLYNSVRDVPQDGDHEDWNALLRWNRNKRIVSVFARKDIPKDKEILLNYGAKYNKWGPM